MAALRTVRETHHPPLWCVSRTLQNCSPRDDRQWSRITSSIVPPGLETFPVLSFLSTLNRWSALERLSGTTTFSPPKRLRVNRHPTSGPDNHACRGEKAACRGEDIAARPIRPRCDLYWRGRMPIGQEVALGPSAAASHFRKRHDGGSPPSYTSLTKGESL